ncbi:MAG: glycosyltransferase [Ignavibacteria bacterium]|nr:glycosyltransferase [Ignavibacteria bacterium]
MNRRRINEALFVFAFFVLGPVLFFCLYFMCRVSLFTAAIAVLALHYALFTLWIQSGLRKLAGGYKRNVFLRKVSIVIPFRNEQEVIEENLKSIIAQKYPRELMEIIYIDDHSSDASIDIIRNLVTDISIKIISLKDLGKGYNGKKAALEAGIRNASGEIIITSDADCRYVEKWVSTMVAMLDANTAYLAGPVMYAGESNTWALMQQYEYAGLVLTGAGFIGNGLPTIAYGANSAFRKEDFIYAGGFAAEIKTESGDDEQIMRLVQARRGGEVSYCYSADAIAYTKPNKTVQQFIHQRNRWASKAGRYGFGLTVLVLLPIFLFYISIIIAAFQVVFGCSAALLYVLTGVLLVKMFGEYLVLNTGKKVFQLSIRFPVLLLTTLIQPIYIVSSTIVGVMRPFIWKGRVVE